MLVPEWEKKWIPTERGFAFCHQTEHCERAPPQHILTEIGEMG